MSETLSGSNQDMKSPLSGEVDGLGAAGNAPRDMISLDDVDGAGAEPTAARTSGGGKGDTLMQAAEAFEIQLQQMSAWKHQLATQMEMLRRDGIKMLERQKNMAVERRKLAGEREGLEREKNEGKRLKDEVEGARKALEERAASLEKTASELMELQEQRAKWVAELGSAREGAEREKSEEKRLKGEVEGLSAKVAEYRKLEGERETLLKQIGEAKSTLQELAAAQEEVQAQRREMEIRAGELKRQGETFAERERKIVVQEAGMAEAAEQIDADRKALTVGQAQLVQQKDQLEAQIREQAAWLEDARHTIESEQVSSKEQVAAAVARLAELSEAQKKFEVEKQELAQRAISLEAQELQLAKREAEVAETVGVLKGQEEALRGAQEELAAHQAKLAAAESTLAGHREKIEGELAERVAAAGVLEATLKGREEELAGWKAAAQKTLDEREAELADEAEHVAKQTKRLNERRAAVEAEAARIEAVVAERMKGVGAKSEGRSLKAEEELRESREEAGELRAEVLRLEEAMKGLGEKAEGGRKEAEGKRHEAETALGTVEEKLTAAIGKIEALEGELIEFAGTKKKLAALEQIAAGLDGQVAELKKELEGWVAKGQGWEEELAKGEKARERVVAEYEEKLAAGEQARQEAQALVDAGRLASRPYEEEGGGAAAKFQETIKALEGQRDELGVDLIAAQEALKKIQEETAISRATMEAELTHLRVRCEKLDGEVRKAKEARSQTPLPKPEASRLRAGDGARDVAQRMRLLRQARKLRAYRKQQAEMKGSLETNRVEVAQQRESLQVRKENLEQVKRLLEKQEMVMARKLADHSAIKTVAAVILGVGMILGMTFFAVYKFVSPIYGSEALVQVAAPANMGAAEAGVWLNQQAEAVGSQGVTFEAWKKLCADDVKYGVQGSREEWAATLPKNLVTSVKNEGSTKTLSIQYDSTSAEGAAQVCNALASAYVTEVGERGKGTGERAAELAKAVARTSPKKDGRLMTALTVTAGLLLTALVAVMMGRYYVRRQLREIDKMADEEDLEDIKGEMAVE